MVPPTKGPSKGAPAARCLRPTNGWLAPRRCGSRWSKTQRAKRAPSRKQCFAKPPAMVPQTMSDSRKKGTMLAVPLKQCLRPRTMLAVPETMLASAIGNYACRPANNERSGSYVAPTSPLLRSRKQCLRAKLIAVATLVSLAHK